MWAGRGVGAPMGYRTLASSRASGTGSAGSSRLGSTTALADEAAMDQAGGYGQGQYMQQQQQVGPEEAARGASWGADAPAAKVTSVEDDWGKVEELLKESEEVHPEQVRCL